MIHRRSHVLGLDGHDCVSQLLSHQICMYYVLTHHQMQCKTVARPIPLHLYQWKWCTVPLHQLTVLTLFSHTVLSALHCYSKLWVSLRFMNQDKEFNWKPLETWTIRCGLSCIGFSVINSKFNNKLEDHHKVKHEAGKLIWFQSDSILCAGSCIICLQWCGVHRRRLARPAHPVWQHQSQGSHESWALWSRLQICVPHDRYRKPWWRVDFLITMSTQGRNYFLVLMKF